ncbi:MAG: hypothetical protein A2V64_06645 [Bacteroidetes bacterium RBG_13_43_22]|nr:MAG: hypothetical protein A2V64_06645 [Bacteroidetes bacterium RBG_13_43_22]
MKISKLILIVALGCFLVSCEDVLNKTDLTAISEDAVWDDLELATAYVSEIYDNNLPGWDLGVADHSDESDEGESYMYGQLTENSVNTWNYSGIRAINILLTSIDKGTLNGPDKNRLKGEAFFFRAWSYFDMVRLYGGVPLILEPQKLTDDLFVKRAPTSVVMNQIISDLDSAIANLPVIKATNSTENVGRVNRGTAMAMKGRVLLYYASPQFDPSQTASGRWQAVYNANKEAKDFLIAQDYGLYANFKNIWITEMNKEVLFVRRYEYPLKPDPVHWSAATRPLDVSQGAAGRNQPVLEMINAFPMKDGRAIDDLTSSYTYDPMYFWKNRDPRFQATIVYNGCLWELNGAKGRIQWTFIGSESNSPTETGFYCKKAVDENFDGEKAYNSATDYVELRFAEVLLNLAEAANAIGNTSEAYDELKAIRARAGIDPGTDNLYGLNAGMNKAQMQDAIILERKIEMAFEGKRYWDLRRNRMFEGLLNGTRRHGYNVELLIPKDDFDDIVSSMPSALLLDHLATNYTTYFKHTLVERDIQFTINWKPEYYFFAIPTSHLELNSNLEQTLGWSGGTFDPLE